jgi:hypothetical protein
MVAVTLGACDTENPNPPSASPGSSGPAPSETGKVTASPTSTASPSENSPSSSTARGCVGNAKVPGNSEQASIPDADGDGESDVAYLLRGSTNVEIGVKTSKGARLTTSIGGAGPVSILGAADATSDGRADLFLSSRQPDGTGVSLIVVETCKLLRVLNASNEPYTFIVGGSRSMGKGVECADVDSDGRRDLVGISYRRNGDQVVAVRTQVLVTAGRARNGRKVTTNFTSPRDDAAIERLRQATCNGPLKPALEG